MSPPPDAPGHDDGASPAATVEPYTLQVNGQDTPVDPIWIGESLLHVLRERLGFAGTKNACDQGECGSCTVIMDGQPVVSCCVMAADAVGSSITTIEGLEAPTDVQTAFLDAGAVQCGFCTPGLILATHDLLDRDPEADELAIREALSGNLCRCTGYGRILDAVQTVRDQRLNQSRSQP